MSLYLDLTMPTFNINGDAEGLGIILRTRSTPQVMRHLAWDTKARSGQGWPVEEVGRTRDRAGNSLVEFHLGPGSYKIASSPARELYIYDVEVVIESEDAMLVRVAAEETPVPLGWIVEDVFGHHVIVKDARFTVAEDFNGVRVLQDGEPLVQRVDAWERLLSD